MSDKDKKLPDDKKWIKSLRKSIRKSIRSSDDSQQISPTQQTSPSKQVSPSRQTSPIQQISPTRQISPNPQTLSPSSSDTSPSKKKFFTKLFSPKKFSAFKPKRIRNIFEKTASSSKRPILCSQCSGEIFETELSPIRPSGREVGPLISISSIRLESGGRFEYGSLDDDKIIPTFLGTQTCYDVMLKSAKVVVLSTELLVRNAFNCLVTNEIHSAPLWESETFSFIGFLTITDFINVLRHYYYSPLEDIKSIENQTISTWRRITGIDKPLVKIRPNDSLVDATKLLIQERVHRLPVYDEVRNCVLSILTRKRLLQYLYKNLLEKMKQNYMKIPSFLNLSLDDLKPQLGTWENIAMVYTDTKVIEALNLFNERKVSVLPVLNKENKFVDIYSKFDVFALAKDQTYDNLNMKIKDAIVLAEHEHIHEIAYGCELKETLLTVIEGFVEYKCHRLLVHIDYTTVIGIISLSDILKFLVLPHAEEASISPDTIDETPEGAVGGSEDSSVFFDSKVDIHQPSTSKVDIHQPSTSKVDIHQPSTSKDDIQQPSTSKDSEQPKSAEKQDLSVISGDLEKLQLQAAILQSFSETSESEKS